MQRAETVLSIIHERGKRGLPLKNLYRQLYNPELYLRAYAKLYSNDGAMTAGATTETVDAMSMKKIEKLIDDLRQERYRWTPVRRVYIEKKHSTKKRPLGMPSWTDKLLQEAIRQLLEAYYEPTCSPSSHGFRPERGCHTALSEITHQWVGTRWFIEGDVKGCFDNIDHEVLLSILKERIQDNRFLRLIEHLLQAGHLEDWRYHKTLSGTPQGTIVSPVLANIYLDKLDKFVETDLLPQYNQGEQRQLNPAYSRIRQRMYKCRKRGNFKEAKELWKQLQRLPSRKTHDEHYRRLRYLRYADDWLLGFAGPREEAEEIKQKLKKFLGDHLKLELSEEKTLITHAATQAARFLGYEIITLQADDKHDRHGYRCINARLSLRLPLDVLQKKCALFMHRGQPNSRPELVQDDDFTIMSRYQQEYRGVVQYYVLASNVCWLWKLHWIMRGSLLKTLAAKHKSSMKAMLRKYRTTIETEHGMRTCLEVKIERKDKQPLIARFGGIPLRRQKRATLVDKHPIHFTTDRNELVKRLLANECELCASTENCEVHHIRKLADLKKPGQKEKPTWVKVMAARRRKTLIVCRDCHEAIHTGKPTRQPHRNESLESRGARKRASPVRGETVEKGST
jgi:group II intron reverse transcriptase/maturase